MKKVFFLFLIAAFSESAFLSADTGTGQSAVGFLTSLPPGAPQLSSPDDSSNVMQDSVSLTWLPQPHVSSYRVQLSGFSDFSEIRMEETGLESPSLVLENLSMDTTYYWRVGASNIAGDGEYSNGWLFTTFFAVQSFFAGLPVSGEAPLTVQFADSSAGKITSRLWDFGDGITSTEQNPVHIYEYPDTFTVSLRVSGPAGENTHTKTDYICVSVETGVKERAGGLPDQFQLHMNYPNPFNPMTHISYSVPEKSRVRLSVYDISGRLVITLADQEESAGNYKVTWDAGNLSSGTYFIRFTANEYREIQKCILLK